MNFPSRPPTLDNLGWKAREWVYWAGNVLSEVGGWLGIVAASITSISDDLVVPPWLVFATSVTLLASGRLHKMAERKVTPDNWGPPEEVHRS